MHVAYIDTYNPAGSMIIYHLNQKLDYYGWIEYISFPGGNSKGDDIA